ncbi:MAG: hypothetical protein ABSE99_16455 [Terracidiphilus sp.]
MIPAGRSPILARAFACWNWKCALLSATARSLVYLAAMARSGLRGGLSIVLVEMAYVTLTAGLYAGMQQRALGFRSRLLGNLTIVFGVPWFALALDWLAHRAAEAAAPARATMVVCIFATVSALFHLHVMRRGAFLTGRVGRSLLDDFRRMPRLIAGFVVAPVVLLSAQAARLARTLKDEAAAADAEAAL